MCISNNTLYTCILLRTVYQIERFDNVRNVSYIICFIFHINVDFLWKHSLCGSLSILHLRSYFLSFSLTTNKDYVTDVSSRV